MLNTVPASNSSQHRAAGACVHHLALRAFLSREAARYPLRPCEHWGQGLHLPPQKARTSSPSFLPMGIPLPPLNTPSSCAGKVDASPPPSSLVGNTQRKPASILCPSARSQALQRGSSPTGEWEDACWESHRSCIGRLPHLERPVKDPRKT